MVGPRVAPDKYRFKRFRHRRRSRPGLKRPASRRIVYGGQQVFSTMGCDRGSKGVGGGGGGIKSPMLLYI